MKGFLLPSIWGYSDAFLYSITWEDVIFPEESKRSEGMTVLCIFLLIALWNCFSRNSLNCNRVWGQTVTTDSNHWVKIIPQNNNKMFWWNKSSNREFKCCLNKVYLEWFLNQNQGVDLFCDCAYLVHLHIKIPVILINS